MHITMHIESELFPKYNQIPTLFCFKRKPLPDTEIQPTNGDT